MDNFYKSLSFGRVGEVKSAKMLESRGWKVEDLTKLKLDYDLLITRNEIYCKIEVKRQKCIMKDKICLELEQINKPGWFKTTSANKIIFTYNDIFIAIDNDDLKNAYETFKPRSIITDEGKTICFIDYNLLKKYNSFQKICWNDEWL